MSMDHLKSETQLAAERLARAAGQTVLDWPGDPGPETRLLRARLILEEALETVFALGIRITDFTDTLVRLDDLHLADDGEFDLVEVVDGCCDLNVVVAGTFSALGLPDRPCQREVDRSNDSKLLHDGTLPPHPLVPGKFGKGPGYQPPRFNPLIRKLIDREQMRQMREFESGSKADEV